MVNTINGIGYDSHRFKEGRKLILGGVEIPYEFGLDGHSDADALCHAVIDGILGAAGKDDIGHLFPDTDQKYKNANSIELLKQVTDLMKKENNKVVYIDAVIITEKPKIGPHIQDMISNVSKAIGVSEQRVNIKAKTNEKMGFAGRHEGLAVFAVITMERKFND